MKLTVRLAIISFALASIAPSQIYAEQRGRLNFGNLSIIPGVELTETYYDNIYLGNGNPTTAAVPNVEDKVSDYITHVKPSLLFNYEMPERGSIGLGYQGDFVFYRDNSSNNWKNQQGTFNVDYKAPGGLILGVNEVYGSKDDPYGSNDQYAIGRVTKRWTNDVKTKLGYGLTNNLRSILLYNNYKQKYASYSDASQDFTVN